MATEKYYTTFNVESPCTKSWHQMQKVGVGAFCDSCSKVVVDFTHMTDAQLIGFFDQRKNKGQICGRFHEFQLNRPILNPTKPKKYWSWKALKVLLLSVFTFKMFSFPAMAAPQIKEQSIDDTKDNNTNYRLISGKVINVENYKPMAKLTVILQDDLQRNLFFATTDSLGNFEFKIASHIKLNGYNIRFKEGEYMHKETVVLSDYLQQNQKTIYLNLEELEIKVLPSRESGVMVGGCISVCVKQLETPSVKFIRGKYNLDGNSRSTHPIIKNPPGGMYLKNPTLIP